MCLSASRVARFSRLAVVCLLAMPAQAQSLGTLDALGEALFFDVGLSKNRTQSCASCHDPDHGFADPRGAASIGDDGVSLGDRNAPTVTYAALIPAFHKNKDDRWIGGQFHDGRAATLEQQAGGPPLNPIEMGMPDAASVVARLREKAQYAVAFEREFGAGVLDDVETGYEAMTVAIAAFERRDSFAPFDSKYDRYVRGEAELTREELLGETLFFSQQFTNCNLCHQLHMRPGSERETFSNYDYFNIGVPNNTDLRALNGVKLDKSDNGLSDNPLATAPENFGKFKVPTLRNVAVTGPYMHNGVFADLRTVVLFYNRYNSNSAARQINPETGKVFGPIPVPQTLASAELTEGDALKDVEIDALVAFMKTLTDARFEPLLID